MSYRIIYFDRHAEGWYSLDDLSPIKPRFGTVADAEKFIEANRYNFGSDFSRAVKDSNTQIVEDK